MYAIIHTIFTKSFQINLKWVLIINYWREICNMRKNNVRFHYFVEITFSCLNHLKYIYNNNINNN